MRWWKRILLCVLIVAAVGFGLWAGRRRPSPARLSLSLLGYTNGDAFLCASNSGAVAICVHTLESNVALKEDRLLIGVPAIHPTTGIPLSTTMPQILKPGGSLTFAVSVPEECRTWAATALVERWGARDRAYAWAQSARNPTIRRWMHQLLSEPKYSTITFHSPTNPVIRIGPDANKVR